MEGIVIKKNANLFTIDDGKNIYTLPPSGKTKEKGIFVGDVVVFDETITKVKERKNLLVRPPLANLDKLFIVLSPIPKPDFMLIDKILIYCYLNNITPLLIINKIDLGDENFFNRIEEDYKFLKIIKVCAKENNLGNLENEIEGVCALAGQSAVGKSSIINSLFDRELTMVGNLSKKIERGKQTTRIVELYKTKKGYLADTAGFSMLDLSLISNIEKEELSSYYPDFLKGRSLCKYRSCLHELGECGIIKLVKEGKISQNRYQNYLKILDELKNAKKY